jgi:hypothetical protein
MLAQFGKLLRALASGRDPAQLPAPTEVIPTIELATPPPDWCWSGDIYLYCGWVEEAADVATPSCTALFNPLNSSCIATLEQAQHQAYADPVMKLADDADVSLFDSDGYEFSRDPRVQFTTGGTNFGRPSTCKVLSDVAVPGGQTMLKLYHLYKDGTNIMDFRQDWPVVLTPGSAIIVSPNAVNQPIKSTFVWRERVLDKEELRGIDPRIMY